MIVVLKPNITKKEETAVLQEIRKLGYKPHVIHGVERTVIGAIGVIGVLMYVDDFFRRFLAGESRGG